MKRFSTPPLRAGPGTSWGSAAAAVTGVIIPVQADGIDEGTGAATNESQHSVGVQGDSVETRACVFPKRQVAALVGHEDQLPQVVLVLARHLDHGLPRVQEDLLQVPLGAAHVVTPHLAVAYLETRRRARREGRWTLSGLIRIQGLLANP